MDLVVGKPSNGLVGSKTEVCTITALFDAEQHGIISSLQLVYPRSCYIHESREAIAMAALETKASHVLFIDADMVFPLTTITILESRDKYIIGVDYNVRGKLPLTPVADPIEGRKKYAPFKCKAVGTGLLLVKTDVFKTMPQPWFFYEYVKDDKFIGEDVYFCNKAREYGFHVWCDPTIPVKHLGEYEY